MATIKSSPIINSTRKYPIFGNGTKKQMQIVEQTLDLAGDSSKLLTCIDVINHHRVNKAYRDNPYFNFLRLKGEKLPAIDVDILGFAILHRNDITVAGKCEDLAFVTLHELGHILFGCSEILADAYAILLLGRTMLGE